METLQQRARAIGEEQMYQEPASTKALLCEMADALDAAEARILELEEAFSDCLAETMLNTEGEEAQVQRVQRRLEEWTAIAALKGREG